MKAPSPAIVLGPAALLAAGCSLLLDPSQAPPRRCPEAAAACPVLAATTSRCEADLCAYDCVAGNIDADEDLAAPSSSGCETSCAGLSTPLAAPVELSATVGAAAGAVDFTWPEPARPTGGARPSAWRVCWALQSGGPDTCAAASRLEACAAGSCQLTVDGLDDGERIVARLIGSDGCGRETEAASAPSVVTAPLNAEWQEATPEWVADTFCGATATTFQDGVLTLEQSGPLFVTAMLGGDDLWDDYTVEVQGLIESLPAPDVGISLGARANSVSGHRLAMVARAAAANIDDTLWLYRRLPADADRVVATAVPTLPLDDWFWMRLTVLDRVVSMAVGTSRDDLTEVARYTEPAVSGATRAGRFGVGVIGSGRVRFRGLRVTTPARLPPSPASATWSFAEGLPAEARLYPVAAAGRVQPAACPAYSAAAGCADCLPDPASGCLEVNSDGPFFGASVLLPLPAGLDSSAPYTVALKFAAVDEPVDHPTVLSGFQGPLIASATTDWTLQVDSQDAGGVLAPATWHRFELTVDPPAGTLAATWNGQAVTLAAPTFPPPGGSHHLGALRLAATTLIHGYWTELEIRQPR